MLAQLVDAQHQTTKHQGHYGHKYQTQEKLTKRFKDILGEETNSLYFTYCMQDCA
jgi:hypothetical protein